MDQRKPALPRPILVRRPARQQPAVEAGVKDQRWPGTVMVIGLFVSLYTVVWLGQRTLVAPLVLLRALALCCFVGTVVPYAYSGLRLGMEKLEWLLFNIVAVGPLCVSAMLVLNHYAHGPVQWSEHRFGSDVAVTVDGDGGLEAHVLPAQLFAFWDEERGVTSGRFRVGVARGCLGYWSVTDVEVVP